MPLRFIARQIESTMNEKASGFVSFRFRGIQLVDKINFLGGTTSFDSFEKTYRTSETKRIFNMNVSMIQKSSTTLDFLLTKSSSANCAAKTTLKKTNQTFKV